MRMYRCMRSWGLNRERSSSRLIIFIATTRRILERAKKKINNNARLSITGKLYAVFGKRQGRVISADSAHGFGGHFRVLAVLPVQESFHLARELRTQTSGLASPQLVFSHWEVSCRAHCALSWIFANTL